MVSAAGRGSRVRNVVAAAVAFALFWIMWLTVGSSPVSWQLAALVLGYSAVELVPLRLPQGGRLSISVGVAVVSMTMFPLMLGLLAQCAGQLFSHALDDDGWRVPVLVQDIGRRALALAISFGVYSLVPPFAMPDVWKTVVALAIAGAIYASIDLIVYVAAGGAVKGVSMWRTLSSLVRLVGWAYLSQLSVGLVFVLVVDGLGFLAAPVLLLLGLLLQSSFSLLLRVRTAYVNTVGALARLTERQSPETAGHAERVAALCVSAGRHLGMSQEALEGLSFAATLHDIGYLKIESSGVEESVDRGLDPSAAAAGAAIIESVEFLAPAARVLRAHAALIGQTDERPDPRDGLAAAVLYVACALDHLERGGGGGVSRAHLERLNPIDAVSAYPQVLPAFDAVLPPMEASA